MDVQKVSDHGSPIAATAQFHRLCPATEGGGRTLIPRVQERNLFGFRQWGHEFHRRGVQGRLGESSIRWVRYPENPM
jgi:hypothetical protein